MVCILLTMSGMPLTRRALALASAGILLLAAPASAQIDRERAPHVRPEQGIQRLVAEAALRSPAIQEWIDRLEQLDVTVYIRTKMFTQLELEGRVALLSMAGHHRYLVIELACARSEIVQMSTLGHELFHAIEIAEEASVVNADTLAVLYSRIGIKTGDSQGQRTFESAAAAEAGDLARKQLLTNTRHAHGT